MLNELEIAVLSLIRAQSETEPEHREDKYKWIKREYFPEYRLQEICI